MPRSQPLIHWDSRFNTGHGEIDRQHKALVHLLNRFAAAVVANTDPQMRLFDDFCETLREHFEYEEQALRELGISAELLVEHTRHHAESISLLQHLDVQLADDPRTHSSTVLAEIAHCLLTDLLDEDRYCFVAASSNHNGATAPPIAPAMHAFGRLFNLLNEHHDRIVQARDYYLTLLDDFPTPVCRADIEGRFDWFNRTWLSLTGKALDDTQGNGWLEAIHPDDRAGFLSSWQRNFAAKIPFATEYRLSDASGAWCTIHHIGHPFFDNTNQFLGYICTLFDITEQRRKEASLRVSAAVFEHAAEAIMVTDGYGRIEAVNPAFVHISGYSMAEAVGAPSNLLRSGFHDDAFYRDLWKSVIETGHWQGEIVNRRKNGELFPTWLSIKSIKDDSGQATRMVGVFSDIASQRASQENLMHLAHHDALTGLPNRLLFEARGQHSLERCGRERGRLAILFIDLDNFKPVNDLFGHKAGDSALKEIAALLRETLRGEDTVARFGGDEFVALVERVANLTDAAKVAEKLLSIFPVPISRDGRTVEISASVGISLYPDDGTTIEELLEVADHAMYREKRSKRDPVHH